MNADNADNSLVSVPLLESIENEVHAVNETKLDESIKSSELYIPGY